MELISHYKILKKLGAGGMGEVYLAHDDRLDRQVAIKVFSGELATAEDARQRFAQEARAASALNHPNILTIHDIGSQEGTDFIVMEYVEGQTLRSCLEEGGFSIRRVLEIGEQISSALARAHEAGIVHRDLKPENIMLRSDGVLKILDFGLAKLTQPEEKIEQAGAAKTLQQTLPGTVLGTPGYMSPEQALGEAADARSDIFSLGCLLYEMSSGQSPFSRSSVVDTFYALLHHEPQALAIGGDEAPQELSGVIQRCLQKKPSDRYQTTRDLESELRRIRLSLESQSLAEGPPASRPRGSWRRLPVALGLYLLVSLVLVQTFSLISDRLVLSPHLVDLAVIFFMAMAPAVALVAYLRLKSRRGWVRTAQIGIASNLLLAAALLFILFQGKDLGAATTSLTVTDEEGNTLERVIPKSEFRRQLALFFLENETGQADYEIWKYAVPHLISVDLVQDSFLDLIDGYSFADDMAQAGYERGVGLPLSLQQKFAEKAFMRHFVTGSIRLDQDGQPLVSISLYQTQGPRLVSEHSFEADDPLSMIDEASLQIKTDLGIPAGHIESVRDLPISELWTGSIAALKTATEATNAAILGKDWARGVRLWEEAVEQDPAFAGAYLMLIPGYVWVNQTSKHASLFPKLMRHLHKLPERLQFLAKSGYYEHKKDPDKQFRVLKMWVELYPEDNLARKNLAMLFFARRQFDQAIQQYEKMLEIDPGQQLALMEIGNLYREQGELEKSLNYHRRYAELFPRRSEAQIELARDYLGLAEFEKAFEHYEKALVIEPDQVDVIVAMARLERSRGRFEEGKRLALEALETARTPGDLEEAFNALSLEARFFGRIREALEYKRRAAGQAAKHKPPLLAAFEQIEALGLVTAVEGKEKAIREAERLRKQLQPPMDRLASLGIVDIYLESEDPQGAALELAQLESWVQTYKFDFFRPALLQVRGRIHEFQDQHEKAVEIFKHQLQEDPTRAKVHRQIGRCLRLLGKGDEARQSLARAFRYSPHDPKNHYEMALIDQAVGNSQEAVRHLGLALEIWKKADPEFKPAQKARQALSRIQPSE